MKKSSARARSKGRSECVSHEDKTALHNSVSSEYNMQPGDEDKEGDNDKVRCVAPIPPVPAVHLGNPGVKLEAEGHLGATVEEVVEAPWDGDVPAPQLSQTYVVDLTQQFNRIFVQTTFNSFKEFEKLFNKFKAETGSVFRIKSSCSIAYENSRRKKHFIPSRFKFVTVRYCCVHYGQPKVAGQGIRTKQRYLPCGCESLLSVSYNRGALIISQANMRHNHEVSSEMAPFYAINRRISNSELQEVAAAVEMIPNSRSLQHFLQIHFQRPTTLQDAKNVRARLKALKAPPAAAVTKSYVEEEQQTLSHREEEEEEAMMEYIEEDADEDNEEVEDRVEGSENYDGETTAIHKMLMHQEPETEQELELDFSQSIRKDIINKLEARLHRTLENCDALMFMERISIIEGLIGDWENDNTSSAQNKEESDLNTKVGEFAITNSRNTGRTGGAHNKINANFQANIENLNTTVGLKKIAQLLPRQSYGRLAHINYRNQPTYTSVGVNGRSNMAEFIPSYGHSVKSSRPDVEMPRVMHGSEANERRPVIVSIVKGLVDGCEQAVEVEIEVDGEVAKVKREPLNYHEVYVTDQL